MDIKTIWETLKIAKDLDKESKQSREFDWKPIKCEDYTVPVFCLPEMNAKGSKSKVHKQLSKVLAFIDLNKQRRYKDCCTIMPIPTTNKRLVSICGNSMGVSRLIQFMLSIGLIEVENNNYQYNAKLEEYNFSKTYRYYIENEKKVEDYCSLNHINQYILTNNQLHTVVNTCKIDSFDEDQVRFSSQLHLLKPDNYSKTDFQKYLEAVLYRNYPQLSFYQQMADDINLKYYNDYSELRIWFKPSFTWNKTNTAVIKIGIRATNQIIAAKKDGDYNPKFHGVYKQEVLDKYGLNLEKDVRSSVPRVTLSLNLGYWVSEDVDIYFLIHQYHTSYQTAYHTVVNTCKFSEYRQIYKDLHMRCYFGNPNKMGSSIAYSAKYLLNAEEVQPEMMSLRDAVIKAEGGHLYDNEIFYHESCIYLQVLKHLLDDGFFVWQVYDSWYAKQNGWNQEGYEQYVTDLVENVANDYIMGLEDGV